jgi:hypothetical protein
MSSGASELSLVLSMNLLRRSNNKEPRAFFSLEQWIYSDREEIDNSESNIWSMCQR